MSEKKLPNIIYICADQLAAKFLNCYGGDVDSTPVLASLAKEGSKFSRYYATHPVCAPNRATMLTGRSADIHGITINNLTLSTDMPTYAHVLQSHGYRTGGFGKFHQTPMQCPVPTDLSWLGFDECVVSEDPKWGPYIDWVKERFPEQYQTALAMTNGHSGEQFTEQTVDLLQGATAEQVSMKTAVYPEIMGERIKASTWERCYVSPLPSEAHDSSFITEKGLDFITKAASAAKPFFCHISYVDPHDPYDPPEPYASMFDLDDMVEPLPAEWRKKGCKALEDNFNNGYLNYRRIAADPTAKKQLRALYHGSLKFLDDQIGRVVDYLKSSGLWEQSIVIFSSDHGDLLGDHDQISKGIPHYDGCIRIPLIVSGGAIESKGEIEQLCSTLDLFPTLCQLAAVPQKDLPPLEGLSLAGLCSSGMGDTDSLKILSEREAVAVSIDSAESVISRDGWRLTRFTDTEEGQLFNLNIDPDEQQDLNDDPVGKDMKITLLEQLIRVRNQVSRVPNYRNMPIIDGKKHVRKGLGDPCEVPVYEVGDSPWLNGLTDKHGWKGE